MATLISKRVPRNIAAASAARKKNKCTVVIETPKGSHNKFDWDQDLRGFVLGKPLPAGSVFPYDFGFIPSTLGDDGDPVDVVVLLSAPTFPGCLVRVRLVAVIEAEQSTKTGQMVTNSRLIAVATKSPEHSHIKGLSDLPPNVVGDIEHFFIAYNAAAGKTFRVLGRGGRRKAVQLAVRGASSLRRARRHDGARRIA